MSRQLLLPVRLPDIAAFENFFTGANHELVAYLTSVASGKSDAGHMIYLHGDTGCGKTHLLHATCRYANHTGHTASFVPLGDTGLSPAMLDGLEQNQIVCLDDLHAIAGDEPWERAILGSYEQLRQRGASVVVSANLPVEKTGLALADLKSRLSSELNYRIAPLDDAEKSSALQLRAESRGFVVPEEVVSYVLKRYPRDTHSLFGLLDRIDDLSLTEGRRVTIPLLRKLELTA
jgi:DnaA family protein